jgi:hypothetical protein
MLKCLIRELARAGDGDAEVSREQADESHVAGFVGRVPQTETQGATGVLNPFLVCADGGGELGSGEARGRWTTGHIGMLPLITPYIKG